LLSQIKEPDSLINGLLAERMRVATSFDDLLHWAPRKPTGDFGNAAGADSPVLAYDSAYVLNNLTPLAKLDYAAHSHGIPEWSAADIALAAWTRAFLLNDSDKMRDLSPILRKAHADWGDFTPATGPQADHLRFQSALMIALHGQFQPFVQVNYKSELDSATGWWCPVETKEEAKDNEEHSSVSWHLSAAFTPSDEVLSRQDREVAARESSQLHEKGSAEMFLRPIIFNWAKAHPTDPQVPQALHRLVMVTRYGCRNGDPEIGQISKTAFDILHKQYPKSTWTAQTPYWFK
jgi:hypothetical protein